MIVFLISQAVAPTRMWSILKTRDTCVCAHTLLFKLIEAPINRIIPPGGFPLDPLKMRILIIFDPLWMYQALGDTIGSIMSNYHLWKRPGTCDSRYMGVYGDI